MTYSCFGLCARPLPQMVGTSGLLTLDWGISCIEGEDRPDPNGVVHAVLYPELIYPIVDGSLGVLFSLEGWCAIL
jgi:hypothetical protein